VLVGLGTTGTTAVETALVRLGFSTAKWKHVIRLGSPQPVCDGYIGAPSKMFTNMMKLLRSGPRGSPDAYRIFDDVDAILDSPFTEHLPLILQAYPHARLILTTRDSAEWARRRAREHACTPAPFQAWFAPTTNHSEPLFSSSCRPIPSHVLERTFEAWTAYVRWLAKAHNVSLLELNLFSEAHDTLWRKLLQFLLPRGQWALHQDKLNQPFGSVGAGFNYCGFGVQQERRAARWHRKASARAAEGGHDT